MARSHEDIIAELLGSDVEPDCEVDGCTHPVMPGECEGCGGVFCGRHSVSMVDALRSCSECLDNSSRLHIVDHLFALEQLEERAKEMMAERKNRKKDTEGDRATDQRERDAGKKRMHRSMVGRLNKFRRRHKLGRISGT